MQPDAVVLFEEAQRFGCTEFVVWLLLLSPRLVGAVDLLQTAPEQAQQHASMELDPVPPHATQLLITPGMRAARKRCMMMGQLKALEPIGAEAEIERRHARAEEREDVCVDRAELLQCEVPRETRQRSTCSRAPRTSATSGSTSASVVDAKAAAAAGRGSGTAAHHARSRSPLWASKRSSMTLQKQRRYFLYLVFASRAASMAAHRSGPAGNPRPVGLCCLTSYKPSCSRLFISSSSAAATIGAKQVYLSEMSPWPSMRTPQRPCEWSTTTIAPISPLSSCRECTPLMFTWVPTASFSRARDCSHTHRACSVIFW
eukprot:scaffold125633_cov63-Phaeocystis_antarctica.AAC.4